MNMNGSEHRTPHPLADVLNQPGTVIRTRVMAEISDLVRELEKNKTFSSVAREKISNAFYLLKRASSLGTNAGGQERSKKDFLDTIVLSINEFYKAHTDEISESDKMFLSSEILDAFHVLNLRLDDFSTITDTLKDLLIVEEDDGSASNEATVLLNTSEEDQTNRSEIMVSGQLFVDLFSQAQKFDQPMARPDGTLDQDYIRAKQRFVLQLEKLAQQRLEGKLLEQFQELVADVRRAWSATFGYESSPEKPVEQVIAYPTDVLVLHLMTHDMIQNVSLDAGPFRDQMQRIFSDSQTADQMIIALRNTLRSKIEEGIQLSAESLTEFTRRAVTGELNPMDRLKGLTFASKERRNQRGLIGTIISVFRGFRRTDLSRAA